MFFEMLAALTVNSALVIGYQYARAWYQRRALERELRIALMAPNVVTLREPQEQSVN